MSVNYSAYAGMTPAEVLAKDLKHMEDEYAFLEEEITKRKNSTPMSNSARQVTSSIVSSLNQVLMNKDHNIKDMKAQVEAAEKAESETLG